MKRVAMDGSSDENEAEQNFFPCWSSLLSADALSQSGSSTSSAGRERALSAAAAALSLYAGMSAKASVKRHCRGLGVQWSPPSSVSSGSMDQGPQPLDTSSGDRGGEHNRRI